MPKMKEYATRLPGAITGDEYVVVTDMSEGKTYKVSLSDYVSSVAVSIDGSIDDHETTYNHTTFVTQSDIDSSIDQHEIDFVHGDIAHTNRANLDVINQNLSETSNVTFNNTTISKCLEVNNDPVYAEMWWGSADWQDYASIMSVNARDDGGIPMAAFVGYSTDYYSELQLDSDGGSTTIRNNVYSRLNSDYSYGNLATSLTDAGCTFMNNSGSTVTSIVMASTVSNGIYMTFNKQVGVNPGVALLQFKPMLNQNNYIFNTDTQVNNDNKLFVIKNDDVERLSVYGNGDVKVSGSLQCGVSSPWTLGNVAPSTGTVTMRTDGYALITIGGVEYKFALVQDV